MVEVFRTNVNDLDHANMLIELIHNSFAEYQANFDLDDCDRILRVESTTGLVQSSFLILLLKNSGFIAEILPDDCPTVDLKLKFGLANTPLNN